MCIAMLNLAFLNVSGLESTLLTCMGATPSLHLCVQDCSLDEIMTDSQSVIVFSYLNLTVFQDT